MDAPQDPVLLAAWIERAPPASVASWLSTLKSDPDRFYRPALVPDSLLELAKSRGDPFLNLAIARYGDDKEVLAALLAEGDVQIRRAILINENRSLEPFGREGLAKFIRDAPLDEIHLLVVNPTLKRDALCNVFERKEAFADLPDDRWQEIATLALMNPNLHREYEAERYSDDGYGEYIENKPKSLALRLLLDLPTTEPWAWKLERGLSHFPEITPDLKTPDGIDLLTKEGSEKFQAWREGAERDFLAQVFDKWVLPKPDTKRRADLIPAGDAYLRMTLASKIPNYRNQLRVWAEGHQDKWVRIGTAIRKRFTKPDEIRQWYDREGWAFLAAVQSNPSLHERSNSKSVSEVRGLLRLTEDAEKEGYTWEDTQTFRSWWNIEADKLHTLDSRRYLAWDEEPEPEPSDDTSDQDDLVLASVAGLERKLENLLRSSTPDQRPMLDAVHSLSKALATFDEAARLRDHEAIDSTTTHLHNLRQTILQIDGRLYVLVGLVAGFAAISVIRWLIT